MMRGWKFPVSRRVICHDNFYYNYSSMLNDKITIWHDIGYREGTGKRKTQTDKEKVQAGDTTKAKDEAATDRNRK